MISSFVINWYSLLFCEGRGGGGVVFEFRYPLNSIFYIIFYFIFKKVAIKQVNTNITDGTYKEKPITERRTELAVQLTLSSLR